PREATTLHFAFASRICHNNSMPGKSRAQQKAEDAAAKEGRLIRNAYHPAFDRRATDYCMLGATNEDLAGFFGVSLSAIEKWLVERPSFARAVRKGRIEADARVAKAMHAAATGYKVREEKLLVVNGKVEKHSVTKRYPPNVNAGALWLTNRQGS